MQSSKPPPSSPELLRLDAVLDSLRPDSGIPPAPIADADVTGVILLACERVQTAVTDAQDTLSAAAARLAAESERMRDVTRALTAPPPPKLPSR
jgi:hypothetical protein